MALYLRMLKIDDPDREARCRVPLAEALAQAPDLDHQLAPGALVLTPTGLPFALQSCALPAEVTGEALTTIIADARLLADLETAP